MKRVKRIIEINQWSESCPHCKELIVGRSESHCNWNLSVHIISKHKDVLKKGRKK